MNEAVGPVATGRVEGKTQAQLWGETAVAFILSATATGVFGVLGYVLRHAIPWLAIACEVLAAMCFVLFAFKSAAIVRWWIVLAKNDRVR